MDYKAGDTRTTVSLYRRGDGCSVVVAAGWTAGVSMD
uniref:Uncharacterized protein n=1 Tax=viral metagenome TaxID=1070528 RepID=A0A6C0DCF2_9ZZZZ